MPDHERFAWIAWHMEGDVTGNLLTALERKGINPQMEVTLLFVAAAWWQQHREGEIPRPILSAGRALQRRSDEFDKNLQGSLADLQVLTEDDGMLALSPMAQFPHLRDPAIKVKDAILKFLEGPFSALVGEKRQYEFKLGRPMRRSVEEIGRNDPCRWGERPEIQEML